MSEPSRSAYKWLYGRGCITAMKIVLRNVKDGKIDVVKFQKFYDLLNERYCDNLKDFCKRNK